MTRIKKPLHRTALLAIAVCLGLLYVFFALDAKAGENTAPLPLASPLPELPDEAHALGDEQWAMHGQVTNITQKHSTFSAPYSGANSLSPHGRIEETSDITLFTGIRLWHGAELWINPEIDQGFGFDNTLGAAGFPNGDAYKLGANAPYLRVPRAFFRQVISLGGAEERVGAAVNQLAGTRTADNLTLTVGRLAVVDIFDTNSYAHDPRADFLNWTMIEAGAFDYAADSWGYTFGAAAEWKQSWWTLRGGVFQLSAIPNGKVVGVDFSQYSVITEAEERHQWQGHPGKIKLLAYTNHGGMGSYRDALALGTQTGSTPDVSLVRKTSSSAGLALNLEQELASDLGVFARLSRRGGRKEAYEFTDVNKSIALGLSMQGARWSRPDDTAGAATVVNALSDDARAYFAAGGLGVLVGDGALRYAPEKIVELYYSLHPMAHLALTLDYQRITNPAYNQDRGPVSVVGIRAHAEF